MFEKITVIGVGLLGASFSLALRKNRLCGSITGCGRNSENLLAAKGRKIIDRVETDAATACRDADLVMLSAPVGSFRALAQAISPALKKGALVTDVGSVKGALAVELEKLMPEGVHYIGSHPIAGSDRSGIDAADEELFRGAKCIITPTDNSDPSALEKIRKMWESLGCSLMTLTPFEHDRVYASVSHLPHVAAYAMVNAVADLDRSYLSFSGKGFMDATRIASSSEEIWSDICLLNRDNILEIISVFQANLDKLAGHIRAGNEEELKAGFRKARQLREALG